MSGEHTLHEPGERVPVRVEADANGNIPDEGDLVAVVGESRNGVHVALPAAAGDGVALLDRVPLGDNGESVDPADTFTAGDEVGGSMVKLRHPVDWFVDNGATLGDLVVTDGAGVRTYDTTAEVDGGPADTPELIFGRVWRTRPKAEGTNGKVGVVRYR